MTFDARGKRRRRYPLADYQTPYEKLKSLPEAARQLKPGVSWAKLEQMAGQMSDTQWAGRMHTAKARLLRQCKLLYPLPPVFG